MIDKFLAFKSSKRCGHETLIQTTNKSCEQNTVTTFNDIGNVRHGVAETKRDVFRTLWRTS